MGAVVTMSSKLRKAAAKFSPELLLCVKECHAFLVHGENPTDEHLERVIVLMNDTLNKISEEPQ